ncbi:nucleotidyltransferase family protein [Catellatospora paridis]|uniref:nucleotidyltransferase family protein n=1 Tax=Catellatospora paridis TaxID=1617086 RepID=UPI001E43F104|nr:nucleotidyltransferase domain-containing protein [Catellatospora paridis]
MPDMMEFCAHAVAELTVRGQLHGEPVVLVGSHARGTATAESDVDLLVLGQGPEYLLEVIGERLVALSWRTPQEQRRRFAAPASAVAEVPAWRAGVVVQDAEGIAAGLRAQALAFTWKALAAQADEWVAEQVTGLAEEAHKVAAALRTGRARMAAVQRNVLVLRLPMVLAVHLGLLYDSENEVWDLVAAAAGGAWADLQDAALGLRDLPPDDACRAALALYRDAAARVGGLLDPRQAAVVARAVALTG